MIRNLTLAGLSLLLVLALAIGFVGCDDSDGGNGGIANISQAELVEKVLAANENATTCKFDMDMTMKMDGESMGQSFGMDISMDGDGIIDNTNEEMKMDMNMSMDMDMGFMGDMDTNMDMEMYYIDNTMYSKMSGIEGVPAQWTKMEMPGTWESQDMVSQQTELLEAAELSISDGGKVNGASCYKVKMTPDMAKLYDIMLQQPGLGGGLGAGDLPEDMDMSELMDIIKDFSVVQWYAKDTFYPMKAEMEMNMVISPEEMGMPEEEGTMEMDMAMTMNFKDYDKSVSINLPDEAKGAMDMTGIMDDSW